MAYKVHVLVEIFVVLDDPLLAVDALDAVGQQAIQDSVFPRLTPERRKGDKYICHAPV